MRRFITRFANLFRHAKAERELNREIEAHLGLLEDDFERRGLSAQEAKLAARRAYGSIEEAKELHRGERSLASVERCFKDLRYGWKSLFRTPAFTAIAILTLALGVGANAAIFSVVNAVLLRPLAYEDPDRLVTVLHDGRNPVSAANYIDWRDQCRSFEEMAAAESWGPNITGIDQPEHLSGLHVTQDLFPMLGVRPMVGRWFAPGEDRRGADRVVVLSYGLWRRRFSGELGVAGVRISLDGESYTVVGVMPRGFKFAPFWATRAELWAPLPLEGRLGDRDANSLRIFARLKPGVSLAQAEEEVAAVTGRLERQYPGTNRDILVTPLKTNVVGRYELSLVVLFGAVTFVLLIACANVAHMLLARTYDRHREIAVRIALGAARSRVMAQLLIENLLLGIIGAVAGLALAILGIKAIVAIVPEDIPRMDGVAIDGRVLLFLLAVTLLAALIFGLAPAMQAGLGDLTRALKEGGRSSSDGTAATRLRGFLVASEFALASALLVAAGLTIRSFITLVSVDPGFNPHHVLSMVVSVPGSPGAHSLSREALYRDLLDQARSLPGVQSAGAINHLPLAGDQWRWKFAIAGRPKSRPGESPSAVYRIVMPGYFETMRLPLLRGRAIGGTDDSTAAGVAVVNDRAARAYWPGEDAIGKQITFDDEKAGLLKWVTIIGVAKNARQGDWAADPGPEIYLPALQNPDFLSNSNSHSAYITLVFRTFGNPGDLAPSVRRAIASLHPDLPVSQVLTMDSVVAAATARPRFEMLLLSLFAAVAVVLAGAGIFGVTSYSVSRRTHEIGIRISLGASRADVLRMMLGQGALQLLAGVAAGGTLSLALSRLMTGMLYGGQGADSANLGMAAIVLTLTAVAAVYLPARRAAGVEPIVALRNE